MPDLETGKPYHEDLSFEFSANYDTLKLYNKANLDSHTRKLYKGEFMDLFFRDGKFRTELRDASIDRNPAHDWNQRLFLLFVPFKVEQNLECAAHKLCCFKGCKYNLSRV